MIYENPRTGEYLDSATADFLEAIADAADRAKAAEIELYEAVRRAHGHFVTWELIGHALGITRQAAHARFTKPPRGRLF